MSLASPSGATGKRRRTDSEDKNNSANTNATSPADASTSSQSQSQSQPSSSSLPAHIPKRGARACTACRKGKNRCEGEAPCRRCQLSGTLCVFEKPEKKNVVPMPTNTLDRISRIESQYLIMQSTMIGMQSSLDRIFSAIQMNTAAGTTSTSSSQSFSPIDEPKKFPPLPGFAPPPHKYATYGILPSTAPSSDDESEDTLPRATMNAPIEALQGLANAAAEAAAAAATAPIPVPPRVKKRRKAEPIPRNAFPSVLEKGLVSESEAQELYHIFFSGCHLFIPLFDPAFDTYEGLKERTPFCFDAILAVASKIRSGNGPPTPTFFKCLEEAQGIARSTLFGPIVRKEAVQAMLLLSAWSTNGWLPCGHAMRMALDLGLHRALDKLADSGSLQVGNTNDRAEDFMNTSPGGSLRDDIIDIDMPEHTNSNNSNVNGSSRNRARSMSGSASASASASGSGSGSGSVTPPPASGTPSTMKSQQQSTATSTTKTQSGPTPSSDSTHPGSTSNPNIKKRSEEEERDLVVSARIWLCLYWFDHQLSLGTGRPIVLRNDNSIKHCRLLLSHPMSSPTDVRLVAQIELIMQKTQIYETLSSMISDRQTATSNTNNTSSSSSSSSSTIINIIRRAQVGLDKWWAEWDALHASQGHPPHSLLRKILSSELYYAKLWLVCVALRGASWDKLPFEQREMAFQAKEAASRCLEVFLGCTEYRAALRYAVHDSLVTAAFSGLFLLKMAHLFPAEVDIAAIAMQVEQLAGLLSDVAAERYAVTLRLMLLNLRRKMGLGVGYVSYNGAGSGSGNGNASGNSVHPSQQQQMSNLGRSQGQVHPEGIPPQQQQQQQQQIGMGSLPIPSTVLVSPTHPHPHSHSHSHSHLQPQHTHPHAQLHAQLHAQHTQAQAQHQQQSHPHQHQHISHSHSHSHLHPQQHVHPHPHPHSHSHPHQQLPHTHNIDTLSVVPPPQSYLDPAHTQSIAIGSGIPNGVPGIISPSQYTQGPSNPNPNSNSNTNVNTNQANSTAMLASINTTAEDFGFVWPSDADGGMFSPSMVPLWLQEQSLSDLGIPINGTDGIFLNFSGVGMSGWNGDFVGMPEAW